MIRQGIYNESGKVITTIIIIVVVLVVVPGAVVGLTMGKLIKYPPDAMSWPMIGNFLAQNAAFTGLDETSGIVTGDPTDSENGTGDPADESTKDPGQLLVDRITAYQQQISNLQNDVAAKDSEIGKLKNEIVQLTAEIEKSKPGTREALIKIYDKLDAGAAVEILNNMPTEYISIILGGLKESKAAEILGMMDPDLATEITEHMAGFSPTVISRYKTGKSEPPAPEPETTTAEESSNTSDV